MGFRTYTTPMGPGYEVYNAYPLMHSSGIYAGQRAATDRKRVVILTRSAYAGQQRNSAITWSGDIQATWQVLQQQVPAGLNFSLSGIPYWNTDTGGFFGNRSAGNGDPANPKYEELFTRWFQFSSFCPMFRVHGSYGLNPGKEFWRFDAATQDILRTYLNLRYRLLPYTYSTAWQVTAGGSTFMQPLVMNFPKDPKVLNIGNQYFFGPSIMVTPVTTAGATDQTVYLPAAGAPWYNFWTGEKTAAGESIDASAPVRTLPLFVRPGAIVPLGPFLQYSNEKPADPIELRIYRGADGHFTLPGRGRHLRLRKRPIRIHPAHLARCQSYAGNQRPYRQLPRHVEDTHLQHRCGLTKSRSRCGAGGSLRFGCSLQWQRGANNPSLKTRRYLLTHEGAVVNVVYTKRGAR
jgi:alpha-D-xyloside xylohydrolase